MFRNCYIKKISLFITLLLCLFTISSCENAISTENVQDYYENRFSGMHYSPEIQFSQQLCIRSDLTVKTKPVENITIKLKFSNDFQPFDVDDPLLDGLSIKEILELYSDFDQRLNFTITRLIYSGKKTLHNNDYYYRYEKDDCLSEDIIYTKEDTLGYFVNEFNDDFVSSFTISYDDFDGFFGKQFCVIFLLDITPIEGDGIRLMRPASDKEVNLYESSNYLAEKYGINVGDSVNFVHFKKELEKEFRAFNYVNIFAINGKIRPLQYEKPKEW
jgi:hypothetical protein